jgi:23S rRNA (cytosine1962-C5)-methyltransferase
MKEVHLKPGKERPVLLGHPWIFSGAIHDSPFDVEPGEIVRVCTAEGRFVGSGYLNPNCSIAVRIVSLNDEPIDDAFVRRRVETALDLRRRVVSSGTDAYRLINGEGDGLPGFVLDCYGDVLVLQCLTAGAERLKPLLVAALINLLSPAVIHERSDGSVRRGEGLAASVGLLHGEMPASLSVHENGLVFTVDPTAGQKTGFFLDQRPNRALARACASGARVLDAFAYSGGFAVHTGAGGAARVVAVESSESALSLAQRNWEANDLPVDGIRLVRADVRSFLSGTDERFDLLILDPPALVKHRHEVKAGARAYRDLHVRAFRRAEKGALMLTFTCSQHVDAELFRRTVLVAAADAGCAVQLLAHLGPGPDHPVLLAHPEGEYLRGLLLRVH